VNWVEYLLAILIVGAGLMNIAVMVWVVWATGKEDG